MNMYFLQRLVGKKTTETKCVEAKTAISAVKKAWRSPPMMHWEECDRYNKFKSAWAVDTHGNRTDFMLQDNG